MNLHKSISSRVLRLFAPQRHQTPDLAPGGYDTEATPPRASEVALKVGRAVRGRDHPPAIMIHGITARTGTNYVYFLLQLHPDVVACKPAHEFFFLQHAGDIQALQKRFDGAHGRIKTCMQGDGDFLTLFGASMIAYLYSFIPDGKRLLLKTPNVLFLNYFRSVFPEEQLLVLLRDGRDVVSSYKSSFPATPFSSACRLWDTSAKAVEAFHRSHAGTFPYCRVQYEDAARTPEQFARGICQAFSLDADRYPYDKLGEVPVLGSSDVRVDGKWKWQEIEKPRTFDPIGRWKTWTAEEKSSFKSAAGDSLIKLGYADDSNW